MNASANDLRVGDTIRFLQPAGPWNTAIVKNIKETGDGLRNVTFFRPYGTTADFSYTGGVICYVGIEDFSVAYVRDGGESKEERFEILNRKNLK